MDWAANYWKEIAGAIFALIVILRLFAGWDTIGALFLYFAALGGSLASSAWGAYQQSFGDPTMPIYMALTFVCVIVGGAMARAAAINFRLRRYGPALVTLLVALLLGSVSMRFDYLQFGAADQRARQAVEDQAQRNADLRAEQASAATSTTFDRSRIEAAEQRLATAQDKAAEAQSAYTFAAADAAAELQTGAGPRYREKRAFADSLKEIFDAAATDVQTSRAALDALNAAPPPTPPTPPPGFSSKSTKTGGAPDLRVPYQRSYSELMPETLLGFSIRIVDALFLSLALNAAALGVPALMFRANFRGGVLTPYVRGRSFRGRIKQLEREARTLRSEAAAIDARLQAEREKQEKETENKVKSELAERFKDIEAREDALMQAQAQNLSSVTDPSLWSPKNLNQFLNSVDADILQEALEELPPTRRRLIEARRGGDEGSPTHTVRAIEALQRAIESVQRRRDHLTQMNNAAQPAGFDDRMAAADQRWIANKGE